MVVIQRGFWGTDGGIRTARGSRRGTVRIDARSNCGGGIGSDSGWRRSRVWSTSWGGVGNDGRGVRSGLHVSENTRETGSRVNSSGIGLPLRVDFWLFSESHFDAFSCHAVSSSGGLDDSTSELVTHVVLDRPCYYAGAGSWLCWTFGIRFPISLSRSSIDSAVGR